MQRLATTLGGILLSAVLAAPAAADHIAGTGDLQGTVAAPKAFAAAKVFAHKAGSNITYVVFTQGGKYDVVNVMPGAYEVWAENANGLVSGKSNVTVTAEKTTQAALNMNAVDPEIQTVGVRNFKDRQLVPYDKLYPPGEGREILENTCFVCHAWNFLSAQPQSRAGWGAVVDYMTTAPHWGVPNSPPFLSPERLPPAKREVLLDYLAKYLGEGAPERAVLEEQVEPRDEAVLGKAQYIIYAYPDSKEMPARVMQEVTFDSKGNVWITEPRKVSAISWLDPRTGEQKTYKTPNPIWAPHGIAIDKDDTVWFAALKAGVVHFDPKTGNWDTFGKTAESHKDMGGLTPFLDTEGNVYWTDIRFNKVGRLDRKTREWKYFEGPTPAGSPYGGFVDRENKFWHAEFHACALSRLDPVTGVTKKFPSPSYPCLIRRPGLDSKNNVWYGVYDRGRIEKLDPKTGKVTQFQIPVKFATPYDTWVDPSDDVWTSSNNYFVRLNPDTGVLSYFPTPGKTDMPKMTITRDGAIWFTERSRTPTSAAVLYPDKAKMKTFAAYFAPNDPNANALKYKGPSMKVAGNGNDGFPGMTRAAATTDEPHKDLGAAAE